MKTPTTTTTVVLTEAELNVIGTALRVLKLRTAGQPVNADLHAAVTRLCDRLSNLEA